MTKQQLMEHNSDLAAQVHRLMAELNRVQPYEGQFHNVMDALRRTKMEHGLCEPVKRNACTHCAGQRKLDKMLAEYKGPRIVLA